ncbi:MAG TPA: SAM-dependent methyltransferase [Oligoflexia bacterium]|nr:SAM-dependent methyltransferase [Oligoflexia bacterium]
MTELRVDSASFKDPCGCVYRKGTELYRQVNQCGREDYDMLIASGLYQTLAAKGLLIDHDEVSLINQLSPRAYKVLKPRPVEFVSYPYEWCFSQLKDAALLTLEIQKLALDFSMSLKDASAFNIQFHRNFPILIDTLSFECYAEGRPWIAYRQFCGHFLMPLALMSYVDVRCGSFLSLFLDGIPLDFGARLLPLRSLVSPGLLAHIHLHRRFQKHHERAPAVVLETKSMAKNSVYALLDNLQSTISKLPSPRRESVWQSYYSETNYSAEGLAHKERLVGTYLDMIKPAGCVWDLGANTGRFSRQTAAAGLFTVSLEADRTCVEELYLACRKQKDYSILPLVADLTNPTAPLGWQNGERKSLIERGPAELALCLALIHHLAIGNNVPLNDIASFLASLCRFLIIEFIPKEDSQVQRLLASRKDIFTGYHQTTFERTMLERFELIVSDPIADTQRRLYLYKRR